MGLRSKKISANIITMADGHGNLLGIRVTGERGGGEGSRENTLYRGIQRYKPNQTKV